MAEKSVQIPLSLFNASVDFLESVDMAGLEYPHACLYEFILYEFRKKRRKLELRESYSKIISADNDDDRWDARMKYLSDKRDLYRR
jgi:hypothetical protein